MSEGEADDATGPRVAACSEAHFEHHVLIPGWRALDRAASAEDVSELFALRGEGIVVVAEERDWQQIRAHVAHAEHLQPPAHQSVESLRGQLQSLGALRHVVWVVPGRPACSVLDAPLALEADALIGGLFRWIKALLREGYGERSLSWTLMSCEGGAVFPGDAVNPAHAGVLGLVGSMAKEYGGWPVRVADRAWGEPLPVQAVLGLPRQVDGEVLAWREGRWWLPCLRVVSESGDAPGAVSAEAGQQWGVPRAVQALIETNEPCAPLRQGGVYVVLGGGGGIGQAWSEAMVRRFDAQVVWVGRRAADAPLQACIEQVARHGRAPQYLQADLAEERALERVRDAVLARYGRIDGVVHSAVGELDGSLAGMDEEHFARCLRANVLGSVNLMRVFAQQGVDFLLFFSTLVAFTKEHGKSAYVAGSQFKDACARELARSELCRGRAMNWGWWELGVAAGVPESFRRRIEQAGVGPIRIGAAMQALEGLLRDGSTQRGLLCATGSGLESLVGGDAGGVRVLAPEEARVQPTLSQLPAALLSRLQADPELSELIQQIEGSLAQLLVANLCALGVFAPSERAGGGAAAGLHMRYRAWLQRSEQLLLEQGLLVRSAQSVCLGERALRDPAQAWSAWQERRDVWLRHESLRGMVELVEGTVAALLEILTGRLPATDVLFPDASVSGLEKVYRSAPGADRYHAVVAEAVMHYLLGRRTRRAARLLEIGAGTGGTSERVLERLKQSGIAVGEYCYTDLSRAFLMHAQDRFGAQHPYLSCRLLDIEKDPQGQGFAVGEFDVVVAANVLHATRDIRSTLLHAKRLLRRGGLLVLKELSSAGGLFAHLTFGLTEGWWRFEDAPLRLSGSPALAPATWHRVLQGEGFSAISFPTQACHAGGQLMVAAAISDGEVRLAANKHAEQRDALQETQRMLPRQRAAARSGSLSQTYGEVWPPHPRRAQHHHVHYLARPRVRASRIALSITL